MQLVVEMRDLEKIAGFMVNPLEMEGNKDFCLNIPSVLAVKLSISESVHKRI